LTREDEEGGREPQGDPLPREAASRQSMARRGAQENLEWNCDPGHEERVDREASDPAARDESAVVIEGEAPGPPIGGGDGKRAAAAYRAPGCVDQGRDRGHGDSNERAPGASHGVGTLVARSSA